MNKKLKNLVYAAAYLALCLVLPFITGQIPEIGKRLSPMHIPVFLCGFICGWPWGLAVGFIAPLLRSVLFGMPALYPDAVCMAFELATYGAVSGLLYRLLPRKTVNIYLTLIVSMILGRCVWGLARFSMAGFSTTTFPAEAFLAGAVLNAIPGIILHIILIPVLIAAMQKAKLILND